MRTPHKFFDSLPRNIGVNSLQMVHYSNNPFHILTYAVEQQSQSPTRDRSRLAILVLRALSLGRHQHLLYYKVDHSSELRCCQFEDIFFIFNLSNEKKKSIFRIRVYKNCRLTFEELPLLMLSNRVGCKTWSFRKETLLYKICFTNYVGKEKKKMWMILL